MDFVLVHGAYHGAWCWDLVVPELVERGHSAVVVDLPISDPTAGAAEYAAAVTRAASDLADPIVVGHSMAGVVLPLVAGVRPVSTMVFLAAFIPEPGTSLAEQRQRESIDPDVDMPNAEFTEVGEGVFSVGPGTATALFYHDAEAELAKWAIERLRPQSYVFMNERAPFMVWPDAPAEYIVCADDHAINPEWCRTAAKQRLGVAAHEIGGGHSPFLTRPGELADLLDEISG